MSFDSVATIAAGVTVGIIGAGLLVWASMKAIRSAKHRDLDSKLRHLALIAWRKRLQVGLGTVAIGLAMVGAWHAQKFIADRKRAASELLEQTRLQMRCRELEGKVKVQTFLGTREPLDKSLEPWILQRCGVLGIDIEAPPEKHLYCYGFGNGVGSYVARVEPGFKLSASDLCDYMTEEEANNGEDRLLAKRKEDCARSCEGCSPGIYIPATKCPDTRN